LKAVLAKLSPHDPVDVKKELQSYSSFLDGIHQSLVSESGFTVKRAADLILSKPIEHVIDRFKFRKYRFLFDMKNRFLKDASYHNKLCSLFGFKLSDAHVSISQHYCGHAKLNSRYSDKFYELRKRSESAAGKPSKTPFDA
jgi:hypothetical protein